MLALLSGLARRQVAVTVCLVALTLFELISVFNMFSVGALPFDAHLRGFAALSGAAMVAMYARLLGANRLFTGLAVVAGALLALVLAQPFAALLIVPVLAAPELRDRAERPRLRWLAERGLYAIAAAIITAACAMLGLTLVAMVIGALTGWEAGPVVSGAFGTLVMCLIAPLAALALLPENTDAVPETGSEPLADYLRLGSAWLLAPFTLLATLFVGLHGLLLLFNGGTPRAFTLPVVIGLVVLWAITWLTLPRGRDLPFAARHFTPAFWWLMIVPVLLVLLVLARQSGL